MFFVVVPARYNNNNTSSYMTTLWYRCSFSCFVVITILDTLILGGLASHIQSALPLVESCLTLVFKYSPFVIVFFFSMITVKLRVQKKKRKKRLFCQIDKKTDEFSVSEWIYHSYHICNV